MCVAAEQAFEEFPAELRKIVCSTNAIESLNARFRKAVVRRGHFPTEQAAFEVSYLTSIERTKNRTNPTGRINAWKSILNTLTIHYSDRLTSGQQLTMRHHGDRSGSVRKLRSGRWQEMYTHPETGERVAGPHTFTAKADTTRWLSTVEADLHRRDDLDPSERSIATVDEVMRLGDAIAP